MATVIIRHVPGYSPVDHFGSEMAALAQGRLKDHYPSRRAALAASERAIAYARRHFSPSHNYSGPRSWPSLVADVCPAD